MQIPEFPVPDFGPMTAVFGADEDAFLTKDELGEWYGFRGPAGSKPFYDCVAGLFYSGGRLSDYGLQWKDGIDHATAFRALRGLLGSFAPPHEIKIGTCAVALANWTEPDA